MMKPSDFLIGVLDFFAILLPGSMATWLVTRYVPSGDLFRLLSFAPGKGEPDSVTLWAAFLLSSYVLGHFVFMAGSRLDASYDRWRQGAKPSSRDKTYQAADALRKRLTPSLTDADFTTLKWAKSYIQLNAQHARGEIDRFEADSKFFRSLVVVSVAIALHFLLVERTPGLGIACLALGAVAYWRYFDQRWKMAELCYGTAVILEATRPAATRPAATPPQSAARE
jgi:hypothetical protein